MKQYVVFSVGDQLFGVEILDIVEIIKPTKFTKIPNAPEYLEGLIDLRGTSVPIINLSKRLMLGSNALNPKVVIVQLDKFMMGFLVDDVSEILKIDEQNVEEAKENIKGIKRNYIQSIARIGEELLIILNLKRVLTIDEEQLIERVLNN
ncbi:chemotaxis protein CheW [Caldicellulosiruptoraceae bacterium PP1]